MSIKRNLKTEESRKFWEYAKDTSAEVASWPEWKRGEVIPVCRWCGGPLGEDKHCDCLNME